MKSNLKNKKIKKLINSFYIGKIIPILATIISIVGIIFILFSKYTLGGNVIIAIIPIFLGIIIGIFGSYISLIMRRFSQAQRIFLSYPIELEKEAISIKQSLSEHGAKVWIDKEQIKPGESIKKAIEYALDDTDTFVIIIGKSLSPNMNYEIKLAKSKGKKIIPVLTETAIVPANIKDLKYVDLREEKEKGIKELIEAVI